MEANNYLPEFIIMIVVVTCLLIGYLTSIHELKHIYLNSNRETDSRKHEAPEFKIVGIEKVLTTSTIRDIAKYTARLCFLYGGKHTKCKIYDVYFYDEIGKYNIGDKLILTNIKNKT